MRNRIHIRIRLRIFLFLSACLTVEKFLFFGYLEESLKPSLSRMMMLSSLALRCLSVAILLSGLAACAEPSLQVMTVSGTLDTSLMGKTLIHEHVFLDWTGADSIDAAQWDRQGAFQVILPHLLALKAQGVQTVLECTPAFLGRDPLLLQQLSAATGLYLLTNTGYYGARENKYLPAQTFQETADEIAARWVREAEEGIADTGIRPGFIKIGVDRDSTLSGIHQKIVRAAARAHRQTGLTIVGHTGPEAPAYAQLRILAEECVAADAFVWTHAQHGSPEAHIDLARQGAWISLDGMGWLAPDTTSAPEALTVSRYVDLIDNLRQQGLLHRLLISHDAGWYTHGEEGGGDYRPYTAIFSRILPALQARGFSQAEIDLILITNPREAYAIRIRSRQC